MLDFEIIQRHTRTPDEDLSLNIDNQSVTFPNRSGRVRTLTRTVYRVHFDDDALIGSVLVKGEWNRVAFDGRHWTPAPKPPRPIPIEQLVDRAEKNLRDLKPQELHRLKAHYHGHPHHWREFAVHLELTFRLKDPQPLGRHVAECRDCRHTFSVSSPSYLFRTGRDRCDVCGENVTVRAVERPKLSREERIHRQERRTENWENLKRKGGN